MKIELGYYLERETKNYARYDWDFGNGDVIRPDGESGYLVIPNLYVEKEFLLDKFGHIPESVVINVSFDD